MADWEPAVAVGIVVVACGLDWALWRHHDRVLDRDLARLAEEAAQVRQGEPEGPAQIR